MINNVLNISKEQHKILLGILLGDAHIERSPNKQSARLKIAQSLEHLQYVEHLITVFGDWTKKTEPFQRTRENTVSCEFSSIFSPSLLPYHQLFYDESLIKRIPVFKNNEFTARSFSYLYMDDGGLKSKDNKGVFINTYNDLPRLDQEKFCEYLKSNFDLDASITLDRGSPRIYLGGESFDSFRYITENYVLLPVFANKIPPPRKKKGGQPLKESSRIVHDFFLMKRVKMNPLT